MTENPKEDDSAPNRNHGTKFPEFFGALAGPFERHEVRERTQAGRTFSYITARVVMNRLDDVCGPENWWTDWKPGENSVICYLSVRLPDGSVVTKSDAGGYAGMSDSGDDDKSGFSDALKRSAVLFGVGRVLYGDGVPGFARGLYGEVQDTPRRNEPEPRRDGPPREQERRQERPQGQSQGNGNGNGSAPKTGRQLFAWVKDLEQKYEVNLLQFVNQFIKSREYPGRIVDLDNSQVLVCYKEVCRKLNSLEHAEAGYDG